MPASKNTPLKTQQPEKMLDKPKAYSWFPGHMRKAQRRIQAVVKQADVFIEIRDARLPGISANPWVDEQAKRCMHVIIMNKAQLAHKGCSQAWHKHLAAKGSETLWLNIMNSQDIAQIENLLRKILATRRNALMARGLNPPSQRLIIGGAPNVGKSTLINRLLGSKRQAVSPVPGVTQNATWVAWRKAFLLMDTPGIMLPRIDKTLDALLLSWIGSLPDRLIGAVRLAESLLDHLRTTINPDPLPPNKAQSHPSRTQPPWFDPTPKTHGSQAPNPAMHIAQHYGCVTPKMGWQSGAHILRTICQKRGLLQQGGKANLHVGASHLLHDFRKGVLGRITLQVPPQ